MQDLNEFARFLKEHGVERLEDDTPKTRMADRYELESLKLWADWMTQINAFNEAQCEVIELNQYQHLNKAA